MKTLETLSSKELLNLYNTITGQSVKRFADRASGLKRVKQLAEDPNLKSKMERALGSNDPDARFKMERTLGANVVSAILSLAEDSLSLAESSLSHPENSPLASLSEVLRAGFEAGAHRQGVPALGDPLPKPRPKAKDARPINDRLVAIGGRVVRKENVAKVLKGVPLWGSVGAPPSEKDALKDHTKLNLNYPAKAVVKPMRAGTKRHKLVLAMRSKGVTVEEVMAMFGLTEGQAVYKLRDLHYMSGHGLEVRHGRVFVTDK